MQFDEYEYGRAQAVNESPGARQRRLQVERQQQHEKQQQMEFMISGLICFYICFNLLLYKGEPDCGQFKTWLLWSLGFYVADSIVALQQLMYIKKKSSESIWLHLVMFILLVGNTSWYIYGNIIYYKYNQTCATEAYNINQAMLVMIVIGYCTMCKCCCITTFLCVAIPCLISMYRQANRPNWEQAAPELLRSLATGKFQPPDQEQGSEIPSCIICMVEYTESDTVVTLPCDKRHYFHDECIKNWLVRNNACPLCKKPITSQDLKRQKREIQRDVANRH